MPRGVFERKKRTKGRNKSAKIREEINANPSITTSAAVEALAAKGVKVTPQLVSNVRSRMEGHENRPIKRRGKKLEGSIDASLVLETDVFCKRVGGIEEARKAISTLERLRTVLV